jgi:hypothetical protein
LYRRTRKALRPALTAGSIPKFYSLLFDHIDELSI